MVLRALNSILGQTYQDIEIIVVDDSPEDYALRESVKEAVLSKKTVRDRKSTRLNSSHPTTSRMPSSA